MQAMKVVFCLLVSPLLMAQQSTAKPGTVRLPKNTEIHLKLDQDVSSATINKGDQVRYVVADDVAVDGVVAIPAGTTVTREVTSAERMRPDQPCNGSNNGSFALSEAALLTFDGAQVKLTPFQHYGREQDRWLPLEIVGGAVAAPVGLALYAVGGAVAAPFALAVYLHDRLHGPPPPQACPAMTHEMEWKARETKVATFYVVRSYIIRASLSPANPARREFQ